MDPSVCLSVCVFDGQWKGRDREGDFWRVRGPSFREEVDKDKTFLP